jgi:hypothetical protein
MPSTGLRAARAKGAMHFYGGVNDAIADGVVVIHGEDMEHSQCHAF